MTHSRDLPEAVRAALVELATRSDRAAPAVFAGREDEFRLLDAAVAGMRRGETGHTVVIQGVPGAGKTALMNEYAARLLTSSVNDGERAILPVPLEPRSLNAAPAAIAETIDRTFREFDSSNARRRRINQAIDQAALLGNVLFSGFTKRKFADFQPSSKVPGSLAVALDEYLNFRFDRRDCTFVFLVDEAQNLHDTTQVRDNLQALHMGLESGPRAVLVCFGLANTTDRLRELGLSRLASGHVRSIGVLSGEDAKRTVDGTLAIALADFPFDEAQRSLWIGSAVNIILGESANFPHHLANGCGALAEAVLNEGLGDRPPVEGLRARCRGHKREYYDARLRPWSNHSIALAHAFGRAGDGWTPFGDVKKALTAANDIGDPVESKDASRIVNELIAHGYVEGRNGRCRPVLPSLSTYFEDALGNLTPDNEVAQAIRAALPCWNDRG